MALLIWQTEYDFGIPEIDRQHRRWIELLNAFYDGLQEREVKTRLLTMLDEAIDYTEYHFREEEAMMSGMGYEALADQMRLHAEIGEKIRQFRKKISEDKPIVSMAVTNEFKDWFKNHILGEDKKYVELYKKTHPRV
jgi:hemerythrin